MITTPDIDTAVVNVWTMAGLDMQVAGSIKSGRRVPDPPQPYASVETTPTGENQFYTESGPGSGYVARFTTLVRIFGIGKSVIAGLVKTVGTVLDGQNWVIPGAVFLYAFPMAAEVAEDLNKRQGEDWWVGTITYEVAASGMT